MKRSIMGVAAAAMALSLTLTACGNDQAGGGDQGGKSFDPGDRITMIVPMGAGGGSDASGRAIASGLEKVTGKSISVENQPGGGGAVGYSNFLSQKGKTNLLLATETALVNLPLNQNVPFTWRSFTPIMKVGQDSTMVVVPTESKYNTCTDVMTAAKSGNMKVSISGGATGNDAIQFNLLEKDQGIKFQQVPYESGGEAIAAVLGGHVEVTLANPSEVMGQLEAKKMKALCAISDKRYDYEQLKDVPTTVEQGINVTFSQYRGTIAPGDIPEEARQYWIDKSKEYEKSADFKQYMESNFMQIDPLYGDDFVKYLEQYEKDLKAGLGK